MTLLLTASPRFFGLSAVTFSATFFRVASGDYPGYLLVYRV
ncbi:hypothetical protein CCP3SC5AM1_2320003 [Gammaproteobacteria bacterium]